jgi:hypothetical protein
MTIAPDEWPARADSERPLRQIIKRHDCELQVDFVLSAGGLHFDFLGPGGALRRPISGLVVDSERPEHRHAAANSPVALQVRFAWYFPVMSGRIPISNFEYLCTLTIPV